MSPDDPRDLPDRDELASALLDGALPPGRAEEARHDPAVMARVTELAAARDRLRETPAPDPDARERALTAALAAFEDEGHGEGPGAGRAGVADLGARRAARGGGAGRAIRWLGVAAALLALAGLAGLASRSGGGGDSEDSTASAALDDSSGGSGAREESAEDDGASAGDRTAAEALGAVEDLGSFASGDDLVDRLRAEPDAQLPAPTSQPDAGAGDSGDAESGGDAAASPPTTACAVPAPAGGEAVLRGRAVVAGIPVAVWVVTSAAGARVVAIDASCRSVVGANLP